jgi:hypothetical protein
MQRGWPPETLLAGIVNSKRISLDRRQRLIEIGDDIVDMLDTD